MQGFLALAPSSSRLNQLTGEPEVRGPWEGGSGTERRIWVEPEGRGWGVESPRALLWSSLYPDPGAFYSLHYLRPPRTSVTTT